MVYHIRVNYKPTGRRVNDRGAAGETLCGSPITSYDAAGLRDARAIVRTNWQRADLTRCAACFNRLLALDSKASERVED